MANSQDLAGYDLDSMIYRWNGSSFVEHQSIPTTWATSWEYFSDGRDSFLALASYRDHDPSYLTTSKIYILTGQYFTEHQLIPTPGAVDVKHFRIWNNHFLAFACQNDDPTYVEGSVILRGLNE